MSYLAKFGFQLKFYHPYHFFCISSLTIILRESKNQCP